MKQRTKLDTLLRSGAIGVQFRKTISHTLDEVHRECNGSFMDINGTTRRGTVRGWRESLKYLLNDPANLAELGREFTDWVQEATAIRDYANQLLHGRRMSRPLKTELADALTNLADTILSLAAIYDAVTGPWAPILSAIEERRESLMTPLGTAGRPDDNTNVHLVVKARHVRAVLATAEEDDLTPPIERVYTPFRTLGQARHEYATGYAYVTPDDRIKAVIYNPPASLEMLKDSVRAAGCRLYEVEVRLTDEIDLTPPKTRDEVLREAALEYLPPDVAEDLLRRAGLPPL